MVLGNKKRKKVVNEGWAGHESITEETEKS